MRKIGIMGGTFNPIHYGHLMLAENAWDSFKLDEIWFIPSADPPHKNSQEVLPYTHRSCMTELAVEKIPHFRKYDFENQRSEPSYTAETLRLLKAKHPDTEFYFIMGADSLFQLETWYAPERVMAQAVLLAAVRDHHSREGMEARIQYLQERYSARICLLDMPGLDFSSKLIRKRVAAGRSIRFFLPEEVRSYIQNHHLYEGEDGKDDMDD